MLKPRLITGLLLLTLATLSACGWQLRGSVALSALTDTLHITGENNYGPLTTELRDRLQAEQITLTETPGDARYTLDIIREQTEKRVAALGSDALASAYELTLSAQFNVLDSLGLPIAAGLQSSVTRSYNASSASAGSSSQEEALILREMREELAQQILRQLQAAINAHQASGGTPEVGQSGSPTINEAGDGESTP